MTMTSNRTSPFIDGAVDGLFFPGAGRQDAVQQLTHLLRYGPALLLLYGDEGIGKHFVIDRLLAELDFDLFDVAMVQADVLMNSDSILSRLDGPWHCPTGFSQDNLQAQLIDCATLADDESRVLLLVVRHAQYLDDSSIELLSLMLASSAGLPVKILLVMDADDPDQLDQFGPLFDRVPDHFRLSLAPFTQAETRAYVEYRMRTGGMGSARFSDDQMQRIFNLSLGNARRINEVAGELLQAALDSPQGGATKPAIPWMHVGALGTVFLLLAILIFSRGEVEPGTSAEVGAEPGPRNIARSELSPGSEPSAQAEHSAEQEPSVQQEPSTGTQKDETGLSEKLPAPVAASAPAVKPSGTSVNESQSNGESEPADPQAPTQAAELARAAAPVTSDKASTSVVGQKPVAVQKPKPVVTAPKVDSRTAWIRSLPGDHYALQLLGAREKATVDAFLADYPSVQKLTYYQTQRNGAAWYVVVQASFSDYEQAKAAVAKLPQKLQKQGPWIRKIEAIQKDLKN
ncbi:MAG: hypothetical protein CSH49_00045 [Alcanivorax sp.]|nr:MAG: hypothetical protein CSH49_00045 [Alcanivorax sp.]